MVARSSKRKVVVASDDDDDSDSPQQWPSRRRPPAPPARETKRVRPPQDSSDDSDSHDAAPSSRRKLNGSANGSSSRKGKERAAVVPDSDDEIDMVEDDDISSADPEEGGDNNGEAPAPFRPDLDRGDDGYLAGSIKRVKLINFLTYDHVEFQPGPYLNMILGPNGTGKSSIAAAIAIGLGFPPRVMGRATDLKSFVKQGTDASETVIELKGKRGKGNPVITRRFSRENEKSTWLLNGHASTRQAIHELVASFGVQANNLCSFLPQDKVADFAKMNPVDVLRETMRAAGDHRLNNWHTELVELGTKSHDLEGSLSTELDRETHLQQQFDDLEPEVRSHEARQDLMHKQAVLECLVLATEFETAKDKVSTARSDLKRVDAEQARIEKKTEPLEKLRSYQRNLRQEANAKKADKEKRLADTSKQVERAVRSVESAESDGMALQEKLRGITKKVKVWQNKIRECEDVIAQQRAILDSPQANVQPLIEAKNQEKKAATTRLRKLEADLERARQHQDAMERDSAGLRTEIENRAQRQSELANVDLQKKRSAKNIDGSVGYAVEWVENHPMEFEAPVCLPPMISVNVPNKDYAWQVEMCTTLAQRKTFICQNFHDYKILMQLNDHHYRNNRGANERVQIHVVQVNVTEQSCNMPRPCTPEQLAQLGFDGFAIDFVEADPPVITFLCQYANMHRSAVTQRPGNQVAPDMRIAQAGIPTWITKTDANRANQSRYGNKDFTITTNAPVPAKAFNLSVDREMVNQIADESANLKRKFQSLEQPLAKAKQDVEDVKPKIADAKANWTHIGDELDRLRAESHKYDKAHHRINGAQKRLDELRAQESPETERPRLTQQLSRHLQARVNGLEDYTAHAKSCVAHTSSLASASIISTQFVLNVVTIDEVRALSHQKFKTLDETRKALDGEVARCKAALHGWRIRLQEKVGQSPREVQDDVKAKFPEMKDMKTEEVREELAEVRAQLEASEGVTPATLERFRRIRKELDAKKVITTKLRKDFDTVRHRIAGVRKTFDPALDSLVDETSDKFSKAFAKIGCTGEVRVKRVEGNYAEWGIQILVSYRNNVAPEVLTVNRQSGGERSLATVTYLMSLSEMARTPFSLVDEINQGMDARAERNVHNQMVDVTCSDTVGQYFLITPKLLTGLTYHPKMKVLIVNNGTWIPDSEDPNQRFGSLKSCLAKYRAHHHS